MQSSKPRKQRYFRANAPLHIKQHFVHAHLSKELKAKLKIKARSIRVVKGDTVRILAGAKKGITAKVTDVDLATSKIKLENITRKNAKGKEYNIPISPSNVEIINMVSTTSRLKKYGLTGEAADKEPRKAKSATEQPGQVQPVTDKGYAEEASSDQHKSAQIAAPKP
ncbi:MAG: 50S ribosomal protein L24 [Candidatus Micrarchaeia archaeon]